MQLADVIVLIVYSVSILIAGMIFSRTGKNMQSFFAADGQAPWWLSGLSLYMSFFSAGAFVVWGGIAYEHGWVAITIQWTTSLGGFAVAWLLARRWKRTGVLTVGEFVRYRLGAGAQQFYTYLYTLFGIFTAGGLLYPVSRMVSVTSGFSLSACCIVVGCIITAYTAVGGLWAVLVTDTLQFVVLMAGLTILLPLSLSDIGGFGRFLNRLPSGFFDLVHGEYDWWFIISYAIYHFYMLGGKWPYVQRYTSVPDERSARKVALLFGCLYIFNPILFFLPAMIYRAIDPSMSGIRAEDAFILMSRRVLPAGLMGLMLAAMLSSSASAANTILNMLAAVFTHDIYRNLLHRTAPERLLMMAARLSTVLFGAAMIGVALLVPRVGGLVELILSIAAITGGATLLPPIWALLSRRIGTKAAICASLAGLGVSLFFKFAAPLLFGVRLTRGIEMAVGVGVPTLVLAVFEIVAARRGATDPGVQRFLFHREGLRSRTATGGDQRFGARVVGWAVLYVGICLLLLSAFVPHNRILVSAVSIAVLAGGAYVLSRAGHSQPIIRELTKVCK